MTALAKMINGRYKAEPIHRPVPWRAKEFAGPANLESVTWFSNHRPIEPSVTFLRQKLRQTIVGNTLVRLPRNAGQIRSLLQQYSVPSGRCPMVDTGTLEAPYVPGRFL